MPTAQRFQRLLGVLQRRQPDLTVLLENVHKPHNFAAILRTADATGLFEAHAVSLDRKLRTSVDSAGGSGKWLAVKTHSNIEDAAEHLHKRGFSLLGAHPAPEAVDYRQVDFTRPTAVVFGQEKFGLSDPALAAVDGLMSIPMAGFVASLNVSVAAAVVLFEAFRQRQAVGLFDRCRLEPEIFQRTLFEWAHPKLAEKYRRENRPYPELGADGEILGPRRT